MISKRKPADKITFQIPPGHVWSAPIISDSIMLIISSLLIISSMPIISDSPRPCWSEPMPLSGVNTGNMVSVIAKNIRNRRDHKSKWQRLKRCKKNHVSIWSNHTKVSFNSDHSFDLFSALRHLWQSRPKRQRDNINCRICSNVSGLQLLCIFFIWRFIKGLFLQMNAMELILVYQMKTELREKMAWFTFW